MNKREQKRLNKILLNLLGKNPGRFLLVGNSHGWIRLADVHKALMEEKIAPFLTPKSLRQYFCLYRPPGLEMREEEGLVRAKPEVRDAAIFDYEEKPPPDSLFCGVRPKALHVVEQKGMGPQGRTYLPLCASRQKARRLGKRFHHSPIIIKVLARAAHDSGHLFHYAGSELYFIKDWLGPEWLIIPQVSVKRIEKKSKTCAAKEAKDETKSSRPDKNRDDKTPFLPGSFLPSPEYLERFTGEKYRRARRRTKKEMLRRKKKKR